jgi:peptidoglycan/xylan/chitin deacetylase (PgdA/CDA1 family)
MSLRRSVRSVVDRAAALTGILSACERAMREGLTLLMYHRVLPDELCIGYPFPSLVTPLSVFREQVRYLAGTFHLVTVGQGIGLLGKSTSAGPALVGLTFDDGYTDNFAFAAPILEEYGARGTFFVTTGPVCSEQRLWFDKAAAEWHLLDWRRVGDTVARCSGRASFPEAASTSLTEWIGYLKLLSTTERLRILGELGSPAEISASPFDRIMTPAELSHLARRGHEIGSHTVTHPLLPRSTDSQLVEELSVSRQSIHRWIGTQPDGFCYPNGDENDRIISATRRAGYRYACTTRPGRNTLSQDPFRLLRIDMSPHRVTRGGAYDQLAMRAEISLLHEVLR